MPTVALQARECSTFYEDMVSAVGVSPVSGPEDMQIAYRHWNDGSWSPGHRRVA